MMPLPDSLYAPHTLKLFAKRVIDISAAAISLIVLSPLFLLVSLLIVLGSRGPIFSSEIGYRYNNQTIRIYRFRSNANTPPMGKINSSRGTGRFLLRSGIDRIPTLINVLRGEMSVVGLRCYSVPPAALLAMPLPHALQYTKLKPGLWTWTNVRNIQDRDRLDMKRELEDDLSYVRNWSLMLDIKIILTNLISRTSYTLDRAS